MSAASSSKPMPVGVVAGEARDLKAEHDTGVAEGDFAHQVLKSVAVLGVAPEIPRSLSIV